jgi:phage N-6-adenine-methyltransferase
MACFVFILWFFVAWSTQGGIKMKEQVNLFGDPLEKDTHSTNGRQVFPKGKSTPDHRTPLDLFQSLGEFQLDAAASSENALCEYFFSEEDDGLNQPWYAYRVWCNPPYSDISKWIKKAINETYYEKHCDEVVFLLPARTCTKWFREAWAHASRIAFVHGRVNFSGPNMIQGSKANSPFPSVIIHIDRNFNGDHPEVVLIGRDGQPLED